MEKPQFSYYKNGECLQFIDNVLTILQGGDPGALKIEPQVTHLDERFQTLEKLYIIDQGNAITKEIQDLDKQRDDALIGINANVDSYQRHFQEEKRQAATVLRALLDKYGRDLYKRSYPEETAGIRNMVEDIEQKPPLTAAVETLSLPEWVTHLKESNDLFDQKYLERNKAYAEAPKEKFADVREDTEAAHEEVIKHLSAHAVITPGAQYDQVINQIDQLTATYNQNVNKRIGSGDGDEILSDNSQGVDGVRG